MKTPWSMPLCVTLSLILALASCRDPVQSKDERAVEEPRALAQSSESATLDPIADTYVRTGMPNTNHGDEAVLPVTDSSKHRTLIRFEQAAIDAAKAAAGINVLESAALELTISDNGNNWGPSGRTVDAHRLTQSWTELGATWNCTDDSDTSNQFEDCVQANSWEMGASPEAEPRPWEGDPTATALITNGLTGAVSFDVTADVQAFLAGEKANFGWIIKRTDDSASVAWTSPHERQPLHPSWS